MSKTILILSGSIEAADAAKRAKELGFNVVVSDSDPEAPAFAHADSCIIADVFGAPETAAAAERYSRKVRKIDGVICVAANAPVTAATVAERLGLSGIPVASAELASDKLRMKERLAECGVAVPWFASVETPQALQRIAIERGSDLVIKPADARDGRGVQRVAKVEDLTQAFQLARSHSPNERVLVEQYLDGPQISTESILIDGSCFTPGFSDRNYEFLDRYAPFFIENGGEAPSGLAPEMQAMVKEVVARAAAALGIKNGTIRSDIVVHDGQAYVIDLAVGLSGGFREIALNTGVDFIGAAIRMALGEPVAADELEPKRAVPVVQRYAFPNPGQVISIGGEEDARRITGISEVVVTAKSGDVIPPAGDKRPSAAMVLATGATRDAALAAANEAIACLKIRTR